MRLVDAQAVADALGVARSYVYEHAQELGAVPLGTGPKPRLRFDLEAITCLAGRESESPPVAEVKPFRARRRTRDLGTNADLLPIRAPRAA